MPMQLTALRVFFASPGGLEDERRAFKEVIDRVNRDAAHAQGFTFVPCGWEYVSSGVGRPQSLINQQVRESDYLVVMLWDQWGRPPGDGAYTSGTEEEFSVGLECLQDAGMPMRDIVVLFKGIPKRQMADPGEGLKKVLAFKEKLETERVLLYSTFDALDDFKDDFRAHLHEWLRVWGSGEPPKSSVTSASTLSLKPSGVPRATSTADDDHSDSLASALEQALKAAKAGRLTEAEQHFAVATSGEYDGRAMTEYVRFLRKSGRATLAEITASSFLEASKDAGDVNGEVEALANLAIVKRQQGHNKTSLKYLDQALRVVDRWLEEMEKSDDKEVVESALRTKAFILDNRSLTLRRMPGRSDEALSCLEEAATLQSETGDLRGAAFTKRNIGTLMYRLGRLDVGRQALTEALVLFRQAEYESGEAAVLGSLGELCEAAGDYTEAVERLEASIAVNPQRNPNRAVMNYSALTRIHLKIGDVDAATDYATQCDRIGREVGTPESLATGLHAAGLVALAKGDNSAATAAFQDALSLFKDVKNSVGVAAVSVGLAQVAFAEARFQDARDVLDQAREALIGSPHWALEVEITALEDQLPRSGEELFNLAADRAADTMNRLPRTVREAIYEDFGLREPYRPDEIWRQDAEEARRNDLLWFDDESGGYSPNPEDPDVEEALDALRELFDRPWGEEVEDLFRATYRKAFTRRSRPVWVALRLLP